MHEHGLTLQELEAAYLANFDLASGYPQLPVSDNIKNLYRDPSIVEQSLGVSPICTPEDRVYVDQHLEESLVKFLGCSHTSYSSISTTFSGAIALDRSIAAALKTTSHENNFPTYVVTTSPSIDIMRLLLEERKLAAIHFAESRNTYVGSLDSNAILTQISDISRLRKRLQNRDE